MRIAIHKSKGSFSDRWIEFCKRNNIDFKIVNAYSSDLIEQLKGCDAFMWHHHHGYFKDVLIAKNILFALEHSGIQVFPDFCTAWHFDDKLAQKYLFETIGAPLVPSYVFYEKKDALIWASQTDYPKVFKLRGGAGSANVKLVKNKIAAIHLINKAFGRGFSQFDRLNYFKDRFNKFRNKQDTFIGVLKGLARLFIPTQYAKKQHREYGYIYFQKFIPNNKFDIRVIVIGSKAFALKRMNRKGDFRASGSGNIIYDRNQIDIRCIQIAFEVNSKIKSQSIAYDFVFDNENNPLIVEISYAYSIHAYDKCEGFWDADLNWYEGDFNPQEWMVEELIKRIN